MNILDWFNTTSAKSFGVQLADSFMEAVPLEAKLSEKKFAQKAEGTLRKLSQQINDYKSKNKLSAYKKAQLGNAFKWRLKDAAYDDSYVNQLTEWLVERL